MVIRYQWLGAVAGIAALRDAWHELLGEGHGGRGSLVNQFLWPLGMCHLWAWATGPMGGGAVSVSGGVVVFEGR